MKCPLFLRSRTTGPGEVISEVADCIKEECAWWQEDVKMCCIRELNLNSRYIQFRLQDIEDKMPHELQFRKV